MELKTKNIITHIKRVGNKVNNIKHKGESMSLKIRMFASKWQSVITMLIFFGTGVGIIWSIGAWKANIESKNNQQDRALISGESKDSIMMVMMGKLSDNQNKSALILSSLVQWRDVFEPEHLELLKRNKIYPKKLYRGN